MQELKDKYKVQPDTFCRKVRKPTYGGVEQALKEVDLTENEKGYVRALADKALSKFNSTMQLKATLRDKAVKQYFDFCYPDQVPDIWILKRIYL